ncbi:MAG: helix-turn-helix domain-containing protein [Burkholderiaceae bacterium]|nr:helix-turn-helix domain-containing protein [Burkholderiaceae bacterium]
MKHADDTLTADLPLPEPGPEAIPGAAAPLTHTPPVPSWRVALVAAIDADPRRSAGIAEKLGVSRPYVSRVLSGSIPEASPRFIARVVALCERVQCPFLQRSLSPNECRAYAERRYGAIEPMDVPHWRACQRCTVKAPPLPARKEAPPKPRAPRAARAAADLFTDPATTTGDPS